MTLRVLVLQKPHAKATTIWYFIDKWHFVHNWTSQGGKATQKNLQASPLRGAYQGEARTAWKFSKLMMEGKVKAAFWPSKHKLDSLVFTKLLKKGLPPQVELSERFLKRNILMPVPPACTDTILNSELTSGDYHLILSTISPLNLFETLLYTMKVQLVLLGSMQ